ncbi:MAG: STAS domain-containing protein [Alphaproteobacteria bacterium]|jgi:anti-sigma B factor antagonist|nr:STAS domain-containing protein [Alphaproteobacteria bacterium]MBT7944469.1 STAS domain-containing protein [Alphaproteobacteria bacterium]
MEYTVTEQEDLIIVALSGDVDLKYSPDLREILLDAAGKAGGIVVDMSGVMMIDSSGVASLLEAFQMARKRGKGFSLASVGSSVNKVLNLARLETVFDIYDDVETARRAIA